MKKRKLRNWVKVVLATIIMLIVANLLISLNENDKKAFEKCKQEHSYNYCHRLIKGSVEKWKNYAIY